MMQFDFLDNNDGFDSAPSDALWRGPGSRFSSLPVVSPIKAERVGSSGFIRAYFAPRFLVRAVAGIALLLAAMSAAAHGAEQGQAHSNWSSFTKSYRCEPDATLQVAYLNLHSGESFAALYHQDRIHLLAAGPTASGARYVAADERPGLIWHIKGDWGNLLRQDEDSGEVEVVLADCTEVARE